MMTTDDMIGFLGSIMDSDSVFYDPEVLVTHASDHTEDLVYLPAIVVKPKTTEEVSAILQFANRHRIPVTPQGARTGLSGGALPVHGGIAMSMERFNKILHIDEKNFQVTVEPGVITEELQNAVKGKGLFYPPDPASKGSCFIGGNIAENSGGPKAVKYGVVKDYVLNLEVVLPDGNVIWTGANVLKNSTGYNLTQLFVGSEGTLGVVTKIVLRLIPHPKLEKLMLLPFPDPQKAIAAVNAVFLAGITPSAMEFMEKDAIQYVLKHNPDLHFPLEEGISAWLLVEVDGNEDALLMQQCEQIADAMEPYDCGDILFAESAAEKESLWKVRRKIGEAVKQHSVYKEEDTVVPRACLPQLLAGVKQIGKKYGFESVCYGHAGDGNLHVNILKGSLSDAAWKDTLQHAIEEIFSLVISLGGTLSGEHGIGWVQKPYMHLVFNEIQLGIFRRIKALFDPNGILNPGKIIDPD
ncbi:MAG: FAD-linked oxidase C-terminal domain-containing protein [Chitinophagales bacterium]